MADLMEADGLSIGSNSQSGSRRSSMSSERSQGQNKENNNEAREAQTLLSDSESSDLGSGKVVLSDGGKLVEESGTELAGVVNPGYNGVKNGSLERSSVAGPEIPVRQPIGGVTGTARQRVLKSGNLVPTIPEEEITIPNDGNLASFSADAMATFLRYLRLEDRLVNHLHRNGLDGRKFGRLKDTDLDSLQLRNPVVVYFRDKTALFVSKKPKQRLPFVL